MESIYDDFKEGASPFELVPYFTRCHNHDTEVQL